MTKVNKFSIFFRVYLEYFGKFYERLHHYKKYLKEIQTRPEKNESHWKNTGNE